MNKSSEDLPDIAKNKPKRKRNGFYLILIVIVVMIFFSRQQTVTTIDCSPEILASKPDVIMLGAWWCSYCFKAKKYFQKNNIHYCEYDVENSIEGKRMYEKLGSGAIPIILIGDYQLSGFSRYQIETALERSGLNSDNTSAKSE